MRGHRAGRIGIVALVVAEIVVCLVAGSIVWSFRDLMVGAGSPQAASNAGFAIAIFCAAAINAIALLPFIARPYGWGWFVLIALQVGDVTVSLAWAFLISAWWWLLVGIAGLTIGLLFAFRYMGQQPTAE
jgi:hypothetical protein